MAADARAGSLSERDGEGIKLLVSGLARCAIGTSKQAVKARQGNPGTMHHIIHTAAVFAPAESAGSRGAIHMTPGDEGTARNIFGDPLEPCSHDPVTGFYRDGCCNTGPADTGSHTVCVAVTDAFLSYTASRGNDLATPMPAYGFPGLNPGDRWCLCASRWLEAHDAGLAPRVYTRSTHERALDVVPLEKLTACAADLN